MKKRIILIGTVAIMLVSVVAIASCKKDKNEKQDTSSITVVEPQSQNLLVTDVHHSDCLNSGVEKKDTIGGILTLDWNGNNLFFEWPDCTADCDLDSFTVASNYIGDTLEIDVRSFGQGSSCTCEYNVDATINNVPRKRFLVKVYYGIMVGGRNMRGELFYSKWINLH